VIAVSNPGRLCRGVLVATLDGVVVDATAIPLVDDGRTHQVRVVLGKAPADATIAPMTTFVSRT
jgi:hypothetical protein